MNQAVRLRGDMEIYWVPGACEQKHVIREMQVRNFTAHSTGRHTRQLTAGDTRCYCISTPASCSAKGNDLPLCSHSRTTWRPSTTTSPCSHGLGLWPIDVQLSPTETREPERSPRSYYLHADEVRWIRWGIFCSSVGMAIASSAAPGGTGQGWLWL